uniref:WD40 repeat-containing protein n=1 Tax=Glossina morsitans morsitans TaxID=37546 RepID=D3TNE4_GLOMM
MDNNSSPEGENGEDFLSRNILFLREFGAEQVRVVFRSVLRDFNQPNEMPVIRRKPDLRIFRHTMMYKEIKALCGLPATSKKPSESWSLTRALMKRENGMTGFRTGSFTDNQQRRIANLFIPNKKIDRLMSLESKIFVCKFNSDGSKLITASQDDIIRIFDASKGTYYRIKRSEMRNVNSSILDIDFSPCSRYYAYSTCLNYFFVVPTDSASNHIQLYDVNIGRNRTAMFSIRFSPSDGGRTLVGGCDNSTIFICDRETSSVRALRTQHFSSVDINAISYVSDQDSNLVVSGCSNGFIKLWDLRCNYRADKSASVFVGHLDGITYIDPRNDGHYLLSNARDQSIKIWDIRQPTPNSQVQKNPTSPLIEWDYRWGQPPREYYNPKVVLDGDVSIMTYRGHRVSKALLRAKFSPRLQTGQRYIYTGCSTGRIIVYDVLTGNIKEAIESHRNVVSDLDWHPHRSEIVSASWDGHVKLNGYRNKPNLKRHNPEKISRPLRRSRRIADRQRQSYEESDEGDELNNW